VGNKVAGTSDAITGGLIDKASGRDQRIKEGIETENSRLAAAEKASGIEQAKKQAFAENQKTESERMAVGSKSKTLLTSAMGLEDDEDSISKRALMGF
jgi:2-keto-3-deoxy-L-rhamnonate aldolase RhmA